MCAGPQVMEPGDTLITTCTYDSSGRTNTTRFGYASSDEMCFNFMIVLLAGGARHHVHGGQSLLSLSVPARGTYRKPRGHL
jgi:hypothetical protein